MYAVELSEKPNLPADILKGMLQSTATDSKRSAEPDFWIWNVGKSLVQLFDQLFCKSDMVEYSKLYYFLRFGIPKLGRRLSKQCATANVTYTVRRISALTSTKHSFNHFLFIAITDLAQTKHLRVSQSLLAASRSQIRRPPSTLVD